MAELNIYSWNVNGIRAVLTKGDFQKFIKEYNPDILCLQETKAERGQVAIDLPDYEEYWNSAEKKGYSGTAIFTKQKPRSVIMGLLPELTEGINTVDDAGREVTSEGRVISAEYDDFFLVTVYTPNAKDDLSRIPLRHKVWDPLFLKHVQKLEETKPVIFCGDLNVAHTEIDLARPKDNKGKKGFTDEEREGFDNFLKAGYFDTFRKFNKEPGNYTWWTHWANARQRNVGWRIDYFLASQKLDDKIVDASIQTDVFGSDHCPVSIKLKV